MNHAQQQPDPAYPAGYPTPNRELPQRPTLADQAYIDCLAQALIAEAQQRGLVVTISRKPLLPLAMGHERSEVQVYAARGVRG